LAALALLAAPASAVTATLAPPSASASTTCATHAVSDFDGDGRSDLVVGVPGKATAVGAGAGTIVVFHGAADGQHPVRALSQSSAGVAGAGQAGAHFGALVETGDFDGDGCADALVYAPAEHQTVQANGGVPFTTTGTLTVLYGRPGATLDATRTQFITDLDLPKTGGDSLWSTCENPDSDNIQGCAELLLRPAPGDFNGDGFTDVAVIHRTVPGNSKEDPMESVLVIPGTASGLDPAHRYVLPTNDNSAVPCDVGQYIVSTSVGDANHDGYDDLATGCYLPRDDSPSEHYSQVDVYYGARSGLDSGKASQTWNQEVAGVPGGDHVASGVTTAFGDFNHDGYDDLAIGHPSAQQCYGSSNNGGASVSVIYGSKAGLTSTHAQLWQPGHNGVPGTPSATSRFGSGLTTGDFNGDGDDELVIRDPSYDGITVLPGSRTAGLVSTHSLHWNPDTTGIAGSVGSGDAWGAGLVVGNFGHGTGQDLVVVDTGWHNHAGSVTELFGSTASNTGLRTTYSTRFTEASAGVPGALQNGDYFGAFSACWLAVEH
jgi:hypothetical protein